jgi:hypothetical protein
LNAGYFVQVDFIRSDPSFVGFRVLITNIAFSPKLFKYLHFPLFNKIEKTAVGIKKTQLRWYSASIDKGRRKYRGVTIRSKTVFFQLVESASDLCYCPNILGENVIFAISTLNSTKP